jgi:hypothetical protein
MQYHTRAILRWITIFGRNYQVLSVGYTVNKLLLTKHYMKTEFGFDGCCDNLLG